MLSEESTWHCSHGSGVSSSLSASAEPATSSCSASWCSRSSTTASWSRSSRSPSIPDAASSPRLDTLVSGSHWGQVAVNHLRERVNMTHVVLSIPAIVIADHRRRHPVQLAAGRHAQRPAAHRHRAHQHPVHGGAGGGAVQLQCAVAGCLRGTAAVCGLGLADFAECAQRLGRHHPWRAQTRQRRAAGLLGAPLRDHGAMQHGGVVSRQCPVRSRLTHARRGAELRTRGTDHAVCRYDDWCGASV